MAVRFKSNAQSGSSFNSRSQRSKTHSLQVPQAMTTHPTIDCRYSVIKGGGHLENIRLPVSELQLPCIHTSGGHISRDLFPSDRL